MTLGSNNNIDPEHEELLRRLTEKWNDDATKVLADAVLDLFEYATDEVITCAVTLLRHSPYWTEQVARAILSLPSDETGEYKLFSEMLDNRCDPTDLPSETWLTGGF